MKTGIYRTGIVCLHIFIALCMATYADSGDADVGGLEIAASDMGAALPGASVAIYGNEKPVKEEETDRAALALFPLEEGEYEVVVEAEGKTIRDTVVVRSGEFTSFNADTSKSSLEENDEPLLTYVPIPGAGTKKDYTVQMADLDSVISIKMGTPKGTIYVSIPADARVGQTVSWSALLVPSGKSKKDLEKNEKKLRDHYLRVGDAQFSLKENPTATLIAAPTLEIGLTEGKKKEKIEVSVTVGSTADHLMDDGSTVPNATALDAAIPKPGASGTGESVPVESTGGFSVSCNGPIDAFSGWPVRIPGIFDGLAENTTVTVGDRPARVEAETRSGVVISAPDWNLGLSTIQIREGESQAECTLRNVGIFLTADRLNLKSGDTTVLHLKVRGLKGIEAPRYVALVNRSRSVITLSGGDSQFLTIHPAEVDESGEYTRDMPFTALRPGGFTIDAMLK
ncbi:MAG: hypothetical protein JXR49_11305 [Acidobacteria bacterium]|nr:hypothetical protein [Acidobacteriota bacterium]